MPQWWYSGDGSLGPQQLDGLVHFPCGSARVAATIRLHGPHLWLLVRPGVEPRVATAVRVQQQLARELVEHRRENNLSKQALADRLHLSRAQLWQLVDGLAPMSLLQACAWADLLGLSALELT